MTSTESYLDHDFPVDLLSDDSGQRARPLSSSKTQEPKWGFFHKWGYPKWLVYNGKSLYKWDDLGVPLFQETTMCLKSLPLKKNCS